MDQNWWNIGLGVAMLITAVFAGVPGVLALMEDTPNAKRLRRLILQAPAFLFFCAPAAFIWLGHPFLSAFAAIAAVAFFAAVMVRDQQVSVQNLLPLVVSSLFCSLSLTLGLSSSTVENFKAQLDASKEISNVLKLVSDRLQTVEKALVLLMEEKETQQGK